MALIFDRDSRPEIPHRVNLLEMPFEHFPNYDGWANPHKDMPTKFGMSAYVDYEARKLIMFCDQTQGTYCPAMDLGNMSREQIQAFANALELVINNKPIG